MASITKRGEHQFQVEIRRKGYPRQTETFETKAEAEKWARFQESKIDLGTFRDLRPIAKITLGDALDRYMVDVVPSKAAGGQRNERNRIRLLKKHALAMREIMSLCPADFEKYREERLTQVGKSTVRLEMALLSHLYTKAILSWKWPLTHALHKLAPPPPKPREKRLREEDEKTLLKAISEATTIRKPLWLEACVRLAVQTGMRAGELLSLEWSQVDLATGLVRLTLEENGSDRYVGLTLEATRVLGTLPRTSVRVIPAYSETGKLDCDFKAARVHAGFENLHFHDLRHEAATRLAPHMLPLELAKIMGWKTIQMAMRYYNPDPEELTAKVRAVEKARSTPTPTPSGPRRADESDQGAIVAAPGVAMAHASREQPKGVTSSTGNVIRVEFALRSPPDDSAAQHA